MNADGDPNVVGPIEALKAALDICKQILTITTAVLALTISFLKQLLKNVHHSDLIWLRISWLTLLISLGVGLLAMGAITTALSDPGQDVNSPSPRLWGIAHQLTFLAGMFFLTFFGIITVYAEHI